MPKIKPKIESKTRKFETNPTQKEFKLNNRKKKNTEMLFFIFFSADELANKIETDEKNRKTTKDFKPKQSSSYTNFLEIHLKKNPLLVFEEIVCCPKTEWGKNVCVNEKRNINTKPKA